MEEPRLEEASLRLERQRITRGGAWRNEPNLRGSCRSVNELGAGPGMGVERGLHPFQFQPGLAEACSISFNGDRPRTGMAPTAAVPR